MNNYSYITDTISKRLEELSYHDLTSFDALLEAEKYSLTSGGKHLRGLILIKTAMLGGVSAERTLDYACAIEMVHTYSLIHDDLPEMDNDDLRRGVPTCHKKFGNDIALLAGDALLTKAFSVIANDDKFPADIKLKCISVIAKASGEYGMLAGQTIDKLSENKKITYGELIELHSRKTGDMFKAAVELGCILGGVEDKVKNDLLSYIREIGIAFQIKDDILDVTSTSEQLGKPVNSDESSNKSTFVSILGIDESYRLLNEKIRSAQFFVSDIKDDFYIHLADFVANRNK